MVEANLIESKFIFKSKCNDINFITDNEGQKLGFLKNANGNNVVFTKDLEGIDVAIEHCPDGTKIFHMERDSKGLPAMHEFKPDGTEIIYLFDNEKHLEKMVEMKINQDKVTTWFSPQGETISQELRQSGGVLFMMNSFARKSLIRLHIDGTIEASGDKLMIKHLQAVFSKYLDGFEV